MRAPPTTLRRHRKKGGGKKPNEQATNKASRADEPRENERRRVAKDTKQTAHYAQALNETRNACGRGAAWELRGFV